TPSNRMVSMGRLDVSRPLRATLPWRGRVGLPKAVRGGVAAAQQITAGPRMLNRCHPLPARRRPPASPRPGEVVRAVGQSPPFPLLHAGEGNAKDQRPHTPWRSYFLTLPGSFTFANVSNSTLYSSPSTFSTLRKYTFWMMSRVSGSIEIGPR